MLMQKCQEKDFKKMMRILFFTAIAFIAFQNTKAQSTYVGGLFPTIDHSGTITKHLDYSFYYFGAFPLVNFNKPDISKDANFFCSIPSRH